MRTNFSRETINTYIYLKNHVINNKSANKQMHMMKASNNKNLFKSYCGFYTFYLTYWKENPNRPNISNAKVRQYIWKIFAQKAMKTLNISFYDIHYQFN